MEPKGLSIANTIKFLEENIGINLPDLKFGNGCLDITPKSISVKGKMHKLDFKNYKCLCFKGHH